MNKVMVALFGLATFILLAVIVEAKPVSRTYPKPCSEVYPVAKAMVSEKPYKIYSSEEHTLIFETGSFWKAGAHQIVASFEADGPGCKVTTNAPYSGVMRNGTVFLDRLGEKLNGK